MNKIDIQITKAKISSFQVEVAEGKALPTVFAKLSLFTENDKKITDFSISSGDYYGHTNFDLPMGLIKPITDMLKELENIAALSCQDEMALLEVKPEEANDGK